MVEPLATTGITTSAGLPAPAAVPIRFRKKFNWEGLPYSAPISINLSGISQLTRMLASFHPRNVTLFKADCVTGLLQPHFRTRNLFDNNARLVSDYLDSSLLIALKKMKARCPTTRPSDQGKLRVVLGQSVQPGKSLRRVGEITHGRGTRQDWSYKKKVKIYDPTREAQTRETR